jgi:HAD superfamily hydrolase (TIGR01549 family)
MSYHARAFLIDFDGPICSVFDGYPAAEAARELTAGAVPPLADATNDPLEVLRNVPSDQVEIVDRKLCDIELRAVETSKPNPEFPELLKVIGDRPWAVVSNNSAGAVRAYLQRHHPEWASVSIFGRPYARPDLMKPNPHLLLEALKALSVSADVTQFIGDSVSDVEAGQRAGVHTIGYANKPGKADLLAEAGANEVAVQGNPWWLSL